MSTALSAPQQQPTIPSFEDQGPDWKRQLAERLDAYRSKHPEANSPASSISHPHTDSRASRIARSVASRYASVPTYSEVLQAEQAAAAAMADAQRAAHEAHLAQEKLRQEQIAQAEMAARNVECAAPNPDDRSRTQPATPVMPQFVARTQEMHVHQAPPEAEPTLEDLLAAALVEPRALLPSKLIEFPRELVSSRRARPRLPEIPEGLSGEAAQQSEAAQLRIFEVHPEMESGAETERNAQADTRVPGSGSEVDSSSREAAVSNASNNAAQISFSGNAESATLDSLPMTPAANVQYAARAASPAGAARSKIPARTESVIRRDSNASAARAYKSLEWAAISLDKEPAARTQRRESSVTEYTPSLMEPASIERRLMAFAVDFAAVTAGFLCFLLVFVASTPHLPTGLTAVVLAGAVYTSLWVLYQMLFFSLSGATAGMLYARIALCTFDDRNPTRSALRRRLAAWWLSCLPLGLGFLWCFVDEDNLSWHDRMTGMYQRSY